MPIVLFKKSFAQSEEKEMFGLGLGEIAVIGIVAFLVIGPKKLPQMGRGLGEGIRSFKDAMKDVEEKVNREVSK